MFQTLALQQLGKLINPISGKMERDLQQARVTIDMLRMVQEKTAGNLTDREKTLIDGIVTELQLNYIDEMNRAEEPESEAEGGEEEAKAGDAGAEVPPEADAAGAEADDTEDGAEPPKKKTTKRQAKAKAKKKKKSDSDGRD
jgi:hypothetical protein